MIFLVKILFGRTLDQTSLEILSSLSPPSSQSILSLSEDQVSLDKELKSGHIKKHQAINF